MSFDISSNCRHFNGSPLLCPINATSSFSYVFTLHYPRVLHCRIVPIQKLKKIFVLGRKKPPITVVLSEFKRSNLKVTHKFAKTPRGLLDRGVNIFTKRLFATTAIMNDNELHLYSAFFIWICSSALLTVVDKYTNYKC